jgi:Stress responsive A/B Barrel Domain
VMIHHVVIWRLKPGAKPAGQIENVELIQRCIAGMRSAIPGISRLQLGINQANTPDAADLVLYSEFESWQALNAYDRHPLHEELRALIAPIRAERRVVDFES